MPKVAGAPQCPGSFKVPERMTQQGPFGLFQKGQPVPKGPCLECGKEIAIKSNGTLVKHHIPEIPMKHHQKVDIPPYEWALLVNEAHSIGSTPQLVALEGIREHVARYYQSKVEQKS